MSWMIVSKATGIAVMETFIPEVAAAVNPLNYDVVDAHTYLCALNKKIRAEHEAKGWLH